MAKNLQNLQASLKAQLDPVFHKAVEIAVRLGEKRLRERLSQHQAPPASKPGEYPAKRTGRLVQATKAHGAVFGIINQAISGATGDKKPPTLYAKYIKNRKMAGDVLEELSQSGELKQAIEAGLQALRK